MNIHKVTDKIQEWNINVQMMDHLFGFTSLRLQYIYLHVLVHMAEHLLPMRQYKLI